MMSAVQRLVMVEKGTNTVSDDSPTDPGVVLNYANYVAVAILCRANTMPPCF